MEAAGGAAVLMQVRELLRCAVAAKPVIGNCLEHVVHAVLLLLLMRAGCSSPQTSTKGAGSAAQAC